MASVTHFRGVFEVHPVPIVTDHRPLLGFMESLQTNLMLIGSQDSPSHLYTSNECLEGKKNPIADALSRIYNHIKIPPTRDSFSPPDNRHSLTAQLPVITNHLTFKTPYLHIPLPTITPYTSMPSQTNNRITSGNRIRGYEEDDPEYVEFLDMNHHEDDRTRALTSELQQAARANRQALATLSAAAVNRLRQAATSAAVATNTTTIRAQTQQQGLVIEEPKVRKLLHSNVIDKQPSFFNRLPTTRPNHIPLNQVGDSKSSTGRSSPYAAHSQHRHTTSLMKELSTQDFSTDEEPESGEEDMVDDGEDSQIEESEREAGQPTSIKDMAGDIRSTLPHKSTEALSPAAHAA